MAGLPDPPGPEAAGGDKSALIADVEHEFSRLVIGARNWIRSRAAAIDPALLPFDYKILAVLDRSGTLQQGRLAELLATDKSMVSRSAKRLVGLGLAARKPDPDDRRAFLLGLTDEGSRRFQAASREEREVFTGKLMAWEPEELRRLADLLGKLNGPA
ncbi:MarR family transcriptional regulator [Arthrobacter sp. I2-34]|uniref:MarR family transcriptional regulator n=1 Tax=Arthrobacter hankyongi TaxID=2904801 RepID=A0ABS9L3Z8_9MICC|nr:MarR family transcriptional regulator [Arthrobacter hankyongi]MCG2621383.1 MarR family transcriptional regulator [Arthrobacter hankyongi]